MASIALPPPTRLSRPLYSRIEPGERLYRLFDPTRFGATALSFRMYGPLLRFDHKRGTTVGRNVFPGDDPKRGIYYAARTLSSCIVEVFGDTGIVICGDWRVARPRVARALKLLDLRNEGAMRAGSVAALAKTPDHRLGQAWSRCFYENACYGDCDGILYYNAHNDEEALALYERSADALSCPRSGILRLDSPRLRGALLAAIAANNMVIAP